MRVEVEKEAKNDLLAIIPLNEGRSEKKKWSFVEKALEWGKYYL